MPAAFFNESVAEQLMQSAVVNVELDHQEANKSIVQFLTEVLSLGATQSGPPNFKPTVDRVNVLIHTYGELLLWHCLHGSIYVLSAHLRYDVARIIKSLIQIARSVSSTHRLQFSCIATCTCRTRCLGSSRVSKSCLVTPVFPRLLSS